MYGSGQLPLHNGVAPSNSASVAMDSISAMNSRNNELMRQSAEEQRRWVEEQNRRSNAFNASQAELNRAWQERMSSSAHQREVEDLRKAGLNPVLSATGGNGSAVTSGATASASQGSAQKADVDTSGVSGMVQMLSSFLQQQTQLEATRLNAQNNMAIADKANATSQLVAQLGSDTSRANTLDQVAAAIYGYDISRANTITNSEASRYQADISRKNALTSASAQRYAADISRKNALTQAETQELTAIISANASKYAADKNSATQLKITDLNHAQQTYIKEHFPENQWQAVANLTDTMFSGEWEPSRMTPGFVSIMKDALGAAGGFVDGLLPW